MQLGMIGAGRMGANMVLRLVRGAHTCVVYDRDPAASAAVAAEGATVAGTVDELVQRLEKPRVVWIMLPDRVVGQQIAALADVLEPGDIVIDGGNSRYTEDVRHAKTLGARGIHYVDVGTSGGIFGRERGYCLMIGGEPEIVRHLEPIFAALAPGPEAAPRTPDRSGALSQAERGYLHCGPHGAGHYVKMVHNAIEYGLMAAYAEGLNLLREAGAPAAGAGAEPPPAFDFDLGEITELWRRGSVVSSWLLDLTAHAMIGDAELEAHSPAVGDSGEGRWALEAAIAQSVPTPVLAAALFARFDSRGRAEFANRVLSAMRNEFGGHKGETPPTPG